MSNLLTSTALERGVNQLALALSQTDSFVCDESLANVADLSRSLRFSYRPDRRNDPSEDVRLYLPDSFALGEDDVEFIPCGYRVEIHRTETFTRDFSSEDCGEDGFLSLGFLEDLRLNFGSDYPDHWDPEDQWVHTPTDYLQLFQPTLTESGFANLRAAFVNGEIENRIQGITESVGTRDDYDYFNGIFSCEEENLEWFNNRLRSWCGVGDLRLSESDVEWISGGTRYWVEETRGLEVTVSPDEDEYDAQDRAERDDEWEDESYYTSQTAELVRAIFTESGLTRVRDAITAQVTAEVSTPTEPATDDA